MATARKRRAPRRRTKTERPTAPRTRKTKTTKSRTTKARTHTSRYVYAFGAGRTDGRAAMKDLLGGKGANLAEMARLKMPVPPGFTISTAVCTHYYANRRRYPTELRAQVTEALARVEKAQGKRFGDPEQPLLVSVRSGARASMPGMMDTILNLGLNDQTVLGLIRETGDARFAYDCYRRFVQMYGDVVLDLKPASKNEEDPFEIAIAEKKRSLGVSLDTDLDADSLRHLVAEFKALIKMRRGIDFPERPIDQLWGAIGAVFGSWNNDRAIVYRKLNDIPDSWGTAVNVQTMVFGNMSGHSGTGVAFTRDPASGENVFYGEYLMNAQGEDVVAGTRTPLPLDRLQEAEPQIYKQLQSIRRKLERHYRDMLDIEFTIERGNLYMLQCRVGKRTAAAAVRIAVEMVKARLITPNDALRRVDPESLNALLRPVFDQSAKDAAIASGRLLTKGLNAGPGAATGAIAFHAEDAERLAERGERVILVRVETSPDDIRGMHAADGILTARGGMTSHAALVGRQMGKVCVVGCEPLLVNYERGEVRIAGGDAVLHAGDPLSIDGTTGEVFAGSIPTMPSEVVQVLIERTLDAKHSTAYRLYAQLMKWTDQVRTLGVRANADQPDQVTQALAFGAEGVGLCRTEHMFFGEGKIEPMREMILSDSIDERRRALAKLLPLQRADFEGMFRALRGKPVTVRMIDPPLHEFLPHEAEGQAVVARDLGLRVEQVQARVRALAEFNPMLGFRGCRLGLVHPEITEMQARAVFEAAANVRRDDIGVRPEIMIPLVGHVRELQLQTEIVRTVAAEVMREQRVRFRYLVGTMIEIPRGALTADEIAEVAEFFSFGTNDLTQTTLGVSRDDAGRFLVPYVNELEIYPRDPFEALDRAGVGQLIEIAVAKGRRTKRGLKLGICGEHGGEPTSVAFCHDIGLDYVSCSPYRVPIARLAAAQAALAR